MWLSRVPSPWLKVSKNVLYRQTILKRLTRSDEAARFWSRGLLEGFQCNDPAIFPNDEVSSQRGWRYSFGGRRKRNSKRGNLVQNHARKRNPNKEPSQRGFDGGYKITSRCIVFGSPVVSRYAQSNNITSEQEKSDNDVNSALTTCSSQKIEIQCCSIWNLT
jgi:hypothetical protein